MTVIMRGAQQQPQQQTAEVQPQQQQHEPLNSLQSMQSSSSSTTPTSSPTATASTTSMTAVNKVAVNINCNEEASHVQNSPIHNNQSNPNDTQPAGDDMKSIAVEGIEEPSSHSVELLEDEEPDFPIHELNKLDDMINKPRWVIPVLPKGELEVLLEATIDLCKRGLDARSEPCQRFIRDGLTISFTKILTDEAVNGWKFEIHVNLVDDM